MARRQDEITPSEKTELTKKKPSEIMIRRNNARRKDEKTNAPREMTKNEREKTKKRHAK